MKNRAILKKLKKTGQNRLKNIFEYYKVVWGYIGFTCAKFERNLKKLNIFRKIGPFLKMLKKRVQIGLKLFFNILRFDMGI